MHVHQFATTMLTRILCLIVLFAPLSCRMVDSYAIKIKGSDTEVNLVLQLVEQFHEVGAGHFISVSGGGSGLGIAALLNGTANLANSSRTINEKELQLFQQRHIELDSFIFAQDAIAFVVSESLPIDSLTVDNLSKILRGEFNDWSSLTAQSLPINIYGRQSNSGTYEFIRKKLHISFSPYAKEMNGNAQILEAIKQDQSGIGYVGAGYVIHGGIKGIKVLKIAASDKESFVSPLDGEMIRQNKYYFQRPLFQYFAAQDKAKIKPFIDFEKTEEGKKIIQAAGYYVW